MKKSQVATGEGKSLIFVVVSILKSLLNETVDVITSSSVLAKRDVLRNKEIFDLFKISVNHNCEEDLEKRKSSYTSNVVYGEVSIFERDILLDKFYHKNIFGGRVQQNVIANEFDSMLLDRGNSVLYLSHNVPDLDKLESIYVFIWYELSKQIIDKVYPNNELIKTSVFENICNIIKKEDLAFIKNESIINSIWNDLITLNVIRSNGIIKMNSSDILNSLQNLKVKEYTNELNYLLQNLISNKKTIVVTLRYVAKEK